MIRQGFDDRSIFSIAVNGRGKTDARSPARTCKTLPLKILLKKSRLC